MAILPWLMLPVLGVWITLAFSLVFAIFAILSSILCNEYILMDEVGVSCQASGKVLWEYEWERIAELKRSSRYLYPSMEVITYNKFGKPEQADGSRNYFQLGRAARKAVAQYYKPKEHK